MQVNNEQFDIVIAGGSFVGLSLALALTRSAPGALTIAVIDGVPPEAQLAVNFDGRTAAISASVKEMLAALGVWERVAGDAQPVTQIEITDSALETPMRTALLQFDALLGGDAPAAFILENVRLRKALFELVSTCPDVKLFMPARVRQFEVGENAVAMTLDNGQQFSARLLVAADGQNSLLRKQAGIQALRWQTGQMGIVTSIAHQKPHHGKAVQHFLPSGPFAILPLTGNRSSLVWTEHAGEARRILALPDEGVIEEIAKRLGHGLGALQLLGKPSAYPMTMTLARAFVKPRLALAGDAAHGLHWIAGQGLNHGLKDVAALAEVLADAMRLGLDIGGLGVLRRYERWRRFDSTTSAVAAGLINGLFSNDVMPLRMMRGFGLGLVQRMSPLKQFFVREAAGLTGDLPRLLRGELA